MFPNNNDIEDTEFNKELELERITFKIFQNFSDKLLESMPIIPVIIVSK